MAVNIVCLGIDLAKNVFALHGVDGAGRVMLQRPAVRRGMKACSARLEILTTGQTGSR
jgi:transposase